MSYLNFIPSIIEYAEKFRELDSLDFKIIKAMYEFDVRNVSKLARMVKIPQQTLSYRITRFDEKDIVRFRALLNEHTLGLKNFLVTASCKFGKEESSSRAMTCFPLWRYLAIVEGSVQGNYVRYLMPSEKEIDFTAFLNELVKKEIILEYNVFPTTSPEYPVLNLDFYKAGKGTPVFDWDKWVEDLDSFPEEGILEPTSYDKANFDLYDLLILRCLEINARMKLREVVKEMARILQEKNYRRLVPLVSRRLKRNIIPQKMIRGHRAYILPNMGQNLLFLIYHLHFSNDSAMRKFAGGLRLLPYGSTYQKVLQKDELFVHLAIPAYEYPRMRKAMIRLGEMECVKTTRSFLGDLANATWGNVEIHQMYKDNAWSFSYGTAMKMLENISETRK
jgi:DNA-binding Lrp family transcriptional regulator